MRPDMSSSDWSDENGRKVRALFVGWNTKDSVGPTSDDVKDRLVAAVFHRLAGVELHNTIRSIESCDVCGGIVRLTISGISLVAMSDSEDVNAMRMLLASGERWYTLGHSELWVRCKDDVYFVSPTMIVHRVLEHGYCPPPAYVDALCASPYDGSPRNVT